MCGFDVEFIDKPVLTDKQRLELEYINNIMNMKWLTKDERLKVYYAYDAKPYKKGSTWDSRGIYKRLEMDYDFISWEDDEPWSIEELLDGDKQ